MNINNYQDDRPLKEKKDDFFGSGNNTQFDRAEEQKEFFGPATASRRKDNQVSPKQENSGLNEFVAKPSLEGPEQEVKLPEPPKEESLPEPDHEEKLPETAPVGPTFSLKPQEPQIGVELAEKPAQVNSDMPVQEPLAQEPQAQDQSVNNDPRHMSDDNPTIHTHASDDLPNYRPVAAPIKQTVNGKTLSILSGAALLVIAAAFAGGFFGFNYYPKFVADRTTMADSTGDTNQSSQEPSSVEMWPIYSNTSYKYSIKYPDTWYSTGTGDPTSITVAFSNNKINKDDDLDGFMVTISFQEKNGKELKDWIETNNIIAKDKGLDLTETEISGKKAYVQNMADTTQIKSYVEQENKIMVIAYEGTNNFEAGKVIYNEIIESIKLL